VREVIIRKMPTAMRPPSSSGSAWTPGTCRTCYAHDNRGDRVRMQSVSTLYLDSLSALRAHADKWDDLWRRSGVTQPTARAALIEKWVTCFRTPADFRAIVLRQRDRFVAALPLVRKRKSGFLPTVDIPGNEWSPAGQLMFDKRLDANWLGDQLSAAMRVPSQSVYWFGSIPFRDDAWSALAAAARRGGWLTDIRPHCDVPYLRLDEGWQSLEWRWSKNFRHQLRRAERRLRARGRLEFECFRPTDAEHAATLLDMLMRLEHHGWKGAAGTSIIAHAPATQFLKSQVARLADWHQTHWALLHHDGRLIAAEYGWLCKSVYHSFKVAYATEYARCSPGQVLTCHLLRRLSEDPTCGMIDFVGPLTPSLARWRPNVYTKGRLVVAYPDLTGRTTLFAASRLMPRLRALRHPGPIDPRSGPGLD